VNETEECCCSAKETKAETGTAEKAEAECCDKAKCCEEEKKCCLALPGIREFIDFFNATMAKYGLAK
jgi:hypothetical protein